MIEVFKTNVESHDQAKMLIEEIHRSFAGYKANFDLQDCDNILRVKSVTESVESDCLINFLKKFGFEAEILPDVCSPNNHLVSFSEKSY
ncbi:MAG TPA: hypothetical protein VKA49_15370 [Flavitalea sp.]|nr:hypothetical protein [Flavitalea sp.]